MLPNVSTPKPTPHAAITPTPLRLPSSTYTIPSPQTNTATSLPQYCPHLPTYPTPALQPPPLLSRLPPPSYFHFLLRTVPRAALTTLPSFSITFTPRSAGPVAYKFYACHHTLISLISGY
ncbi:hypothetical protein BYT27DRAFT_7336661 [Phlegmacium glaucopus]|nr:hypothetical protein BYT27DRAFT_7336661 [Phlegmacium glaucopus]